MAASVSVLFAIAPGASAGITVNLEGTFPSSADIIAATPEQALFASAATAGFTSVAQTFQVTTPFKLDRFFIEYANAVAGRSVEVQLFLVEDVLSASMIPGANLFATQPLTFTLPSTTDATQRIMELDLTGNDEITLTPNTGTAGYAIQFLDPTFTTPSPFRWFRTDSTFADIYPGGVAYRNDAMITGGGVSRDYALALSSIPEPGSASLILASGMGLLLRRRSTR